MTKNLFSVHAKKIFVGMQQWFPEIWNRLKYWVNSQLTEEHHRYHTKLNKIVSDEEMSNVSESDFFPIMNIWLDHHRSQNSSSFDIWRFRISRCTGGALMIRSLLKHCCKVQFHGKIGKKWMKFLLQQSECQCLSRWPYVQFSRLRSRLVFAETTVHILQKIGN